jgi:hypothetical protein
MIVAKIEVRTDGTAILSAESGEPTGSQMPIGHQEFRSKEKAAQWALQNGVFIEDPNKDTTDQPADLAARRRCRGAEDQLREQAQHERAVIKGSSFSSL